MQVLSHRPLILLIAIVLAIALLFAVARPAGGQMASPDERARATEAKMTARLFGK